MTVLLVSALALVVVGIVLLIRSLRRYLRTRESSAIVLTVIAALITLVSIAAVIVDLERH